MSDKQDNSLHPLVPPAVASSPEKMVLRPRPVAVGTVSGVVPLGGRESLELSDRHLPESQGVASNFRTSCITSEVGGNRSTSLIVDSIEPLPVSDNHPCTSTDDRQALLAPLPAVNPGETYRNS